jgi:membrane protease YdiL (CAAX protease family)
LSKIIIFITTDDTYKKLVLARKQKLDSIGITLSKMKKASLTGAVFGIIFTVIMNIIPNMIIGSEIIPANQAIYNIFYYFIVISLSEEIVFRGYIQTRIYALIKRDVPAIIVTGFLFYAMHLPFQIPVNGMTIDLFNIIIIVGLHCVMNFLYRKYNSLAASTIFHGILDWGGNLFL